VSENIDIVKEQYDYVAEFHPETLNMSREDASNMLILALLKEASELSDGYKCFPWKKDIAISDVYTHKECIDILMFSLDLCIIWGITSMSDLEKKYLEKLNENKLRRTKQNEGISCSAVVH
jgi:dimeric dUTPase (all-alpha-NTP-PPase superfamily)